MYICDTYIYHIHIYIHIYVYINIYIYIQSIMPMKKTEISGQYKFLKPVS